MCLGVQGGIFASGFITFCFHSLYNPLWVLAFSTKSFQTFLCKCTSLQLFIFITFKSLHTTSSHLILGLPVCQLPTVTFYRQNSVCLLFSPVPPTCPLYFIFLDSSYQYLATSINHKVPQYEIFSSLMLLLPSRVQMNSLKILVFVINLVLETKFIPIQITDKVTFSCILVFRF
jgi:hypothetical protein